MWPLLEVIKKHSRPGHLRAAVICRYLIMEGSKIHSTKNSRGCFIRGALFHCVCALYWETEKVSLVKQSSTGVSGEEKL